MTIQALVEDGRKVIAAGANELHLHVRGEDGTESLAPNYVDATIKALRQALPGTLFGISTGAWIEKDDDRALSYVGRWVSDRRPHVKHWPLRSRLAFWTAFLLTVELIIFGVASGWVIYQEQLETFREIKGQPYSPIVIQLSRRSLPVWLQYTNRTWCTGISNQAVSW